MNVSPLRYRLLAAIGLSLSAALAATPAAAQTKPFEPQVGQQGKDVVWVPTSQALVDKMLDMAKVTPNDFVMDLGSGDGRTVITAAKRGARAMGVEYNPDMVDLSKRNAAKEGVTERAEFVKADLFETDLSKASVITMFLLPSINLKLRPKMLDMAKVTPKDVVMDLGSGDGRTVITAAKRGARAIGVEFNPKMVELSNHNATEAGVTDKVRFIQGDLFEADLSQASVITLFLLPQINLKLRPKILDLKPGTRVVSNSFTMDDWEADQTETISENCTSWCTALMWIVPAKVEGTWTTPQGDMQLQQNFQMVTGTLGGQSIDGRLRGNELTFTAAGTKHTVSVSGNTMQGGNFKATRK